MLYKIEWWLIDHDIEPTMVKWSVITLMVFIFAIFISALQNGIYG